MNIIDNNNVMAVGVTIWVIMALYLVFYRTIKGVIDEATAPIELIHGELYQLTSKWGENSQTMVDHAYYNKETKMFENSEYTIPISRTKECYHCEIKHIPEGE